MNLTKNTIRRAAAVSVALFAMVGTTACSEIAEPDQVGLYYLEGQSDGFAFDHCIDPGTADDYVWNNSVVWLPENLRTWNIAKEGGDTDEPIAAPAKPEPGQPSGVSVNLYSMTNLHLNTSCDGGKDSPLVQWWEKIGRRYEADTDDGWRKMLLNTVVPALETASRTVVREYNADPLVAGISWPEVQKKISDAFAAELKRLMGGEFFCGPAFDRQSKQCPAVEVILKNIDYTDAGIKDARNAKAKALALAAAKVAEAEGEVTAAKTREQLYRNAAWVRLQEATMRLEEAKACAAAANCTLVIGANGVVTTTSGGSR